MKWKIHPNIPQDQVQSLIQTLSIEPSLARLLAQRGIVDFQAAKSFFRPQLTDLHNPHAMKDMDKAVDVLTAARMKGESILVYGDYDVDGTTSVALVSSVLKAWGYPVLTYIPDRYKEGYGLSSQGLAYAKDQGCKVVVALDCGIRATDKALEAKDLGLQLIICDHHLPGPEIPAAAAVLDPKQPGCSYPYKELCGCGVGFKLLQALGEALGQAPDALYAYLDLVAIAIAADIVPITGENRILAYHGLKQINESPRPGVEALLQGRKKPFAVSDLVFQVAPRINAAGRMEHAMKAVDILTEPDREKAFLLAEGVAVLNENRRNEEAEMTRSALEQVAQTHAPERFTTVVHQEGWHKGVVGIVASRLQETYYRPTLVLTQVNGILSGSGRSIRGFDLHAALEDSHDLLLQYGGHHHAVGLSMLPENLPAFEARFEAYAHERLTPDDLEEELLIDLEVEAAAINPKFHRILQQMAPFGPGNPEPLFLTRRLVENGFSRQVGKELDHLKVNLAGGGQVFGGIHFRNGHRYEELRTAPSVDVVYHLYQNSFNGRESLELLVKDFKPSQG